MLAGVVVIGRVAGGFVQSWQSVLRQSLESANTALMDSDLGWVLLIRRMLSPVLVPMAIVMTASFASALLVGVAQGGGLQIYPDAIGFKVTKINPLTNLKNLFSLRSVIRVAKSLIPAAGMLVLGWRALRGLMMPMPVMSLVRLPHSLSVVYTLGLDAALITLSWSGLDYLVEWVTWNKRMKMTKQEIKDEMKQSQGNPQIKARVRQAQQTMRRRKVKADLSRASVVVTNPTHYAVALEFSFETMQAPTVLAKGRDLHAAAIREEARWAGVPLIENPPLARSLYQMVEPGQSIPFHLYAAVAGILAYLYRQKVEEKVRTERQRSTFG